MFLLKRTILIFINNNLKNKLIICKDFSFLIIEKIIEINEFFIVIYIFIERLLFLKKFKYRF
jgi:hypothetical protein